MDKHDINLAKENLRTEPIATAAVIAAVTTATTAAITTAATAAATATTTDITNAITMPPMPSLTLSIIVNTYTTSIDATVHAIADDTDTDMMH